MNQEEHEGKRRANRVRPLAYLGHRGMWGEEGCEEQSEHYQDYCDQSSVQQASHHRSQGYLRTVNRADCDPQS